MAKKYNGYSKGSGYRSAANTIAVKGSRLTPPDSISQNSKALQVKSDQISLSV